MREPERNRRRTLGTWLCLLATLTLYSPLVAAAWSVRAMSCCSGDHCPIPQHHHAKAHAHNTDCEHEGPGMADCSMRCCDTPDKPALSALAFVLPSLEFSAVRSIITRPVEILCSVEIRRDSKPGLPPPRFAYAVL